MKKQAKYFRKGRTIRHASGDIQCGTINEAKRESHKLQMSEDGALGRGSLVIVEKLPLFKTIAGAQA